MGWRIAWTDTDLEENETQALAFQHTASLLTGDCAALHDCHYTY